MNTKVHEYAPAVLNGIAGIGVLLISFLVDLRVPIPLSTAKIIGITVVYLGMALVVWAAFHIRGAIRGMVKPRISELIITGPYRFIRHPMYVGTTIALVGVTLSLLSWIGRVAHGLALGFQIHPSIKQE